MMTSIIEAMTRLIKIEALVTGVASILDSMPISMSCSMSMPAQAEEALRYRTIEVADPRVVRQHVQDLKALLEESSIVEQKAFLKSFVERIEVGDSEAKVIYTIPMLPGSSPTEAVGVLPFIT